MWNVPDIFASGVTPSSCPTKVSMSLSEPCTTLAAVASTVTLVLPNSVVNSAALTVASATVIVNFAFSAGTVPSDSFARPVAPGASAIACVLTVAVMTPVVFAIIVFKSST